MINVDGSSFRNRSGFVFTYLSKLYRQINYTYRDEYTHLIKSKLYDILVTKSLLIPHREVRKTKAFTSESIYKIIEPQQIPFISYPYEWCFSQFKQAALATLEIQKIAYTYGMILKDATPFNIQFLDGKPILIDTLSFGFYREGQPWVAYRQFCEQFLGPLVLMRYKDVRLSKMLEVYLDGLPLELVTKLLPIRVKMNPRIMLHLVLHAKLQKMFTQPSTILRSAKFNRRAYLELTDSLMTTIQKLSPPRLRSAWVTYNRSSYKESTEKIKSRYLNIL